MVTDIWPRIQQPTEDPAPGAGLARRDLVLLPLIALLTLVALALAAEGLARLIEPEQLRDSCAVAAPGGAGFRPGCSARVKIAESPWIEHRYNACGFRADAGCGPLAPEARRVAVLGGATAVGDWVSFDRTLAGRLQTDLSRRCGAPVDAQALGPARPTGAPGPGWSGIEGLATKALALNPSVLVAVVSPSDLARYGAASGATPGRWLGDSRALRMARRVAFADPSRYLAHRLREPDGAGYLRPPLSPLWRARLRLADEVVGEIAGKARAAHVPLLIVYMPDRAQAALSAEAPRPGVAPFALGDAVGAVARSHGAEFVDVTGLTQVLKSQDGLFFVAEPLPTAAGHGLMARAVEAGLLRDGAVFAACRAGPAARAASARPT